MIGKIEEVAEALWMAISPLNLKGEFRNLIYKKPYRVGAKAAIEAMREPTDAMKNREDGWDFSCHTCGGHQEARYILIDAALEE